MAKKKTKKVSRMVEVSPESLDGIVLQWMRHELDEIRKMLKDRKKRLKAEKRKEYAHELECDINDYQGVCDALSIVISYYGS